MPNGLWDALFITMMTPIVYAFTTNFPMMTSLLLAKILYDG